MNPTQPSLHDLLARYLDRQTSAHEEGLGLADLGGEVMPFDAVPVQPVEPRLAWTEALDVLRAMDLPADAGSYPAPAEWPTLVASHEPEVALPFCLGNFPQLVRHLPGLLHLLEGGALRGPAGAAAPVPGLQEWAERTARTEQYPQALLAVAALRLARQFDAAAALLSKMKGVPAAWHGLRANEEAALAWHRGDFDKAAASWGAQAESVPVLFNRGMAALFLGQPAEARTALGRAAAQLPEDGAWHHLARLYLALAEMRG
jgi:tetratricopeptide (TPR) repeat protein